MEHDTKYYTIPKGKLLFKPDANAGFEDLGNCSKLEVTVETEQLEHYSSRSGLKNRDKVVITSIKATGSFTLDELTVENHDKFFMGDGVTESSQTSQSDQNVTLSSCKLERWHEIGVVSVSSVKVIGPGTTCTFTNATDKVNATAHGLENGTKLEFTNSGGALPAELSIDTTYYVINKDADTFEVSTTLGGSKVDFTDDGTGTSKFHKLLTKGTDYEEDLNAGLVFVKKGGAVSDGDDLIVDYDQAAATLKTVDAAKKKTQYGHVFFVADPAGGEINDIKGYATLTPEGAYGMITEEFGTMNFKLEFTDHTSYSGLLQIRNRGNVTFDS